MARTAIVNPRRRKKRAAPKRRRRNTAKTRSYNRRAPTKRRRRRNPAAGSPARSVYSSGGYRRKPNPDMFDLDRAIDTLPAATMGVWGARFAAKMAGPLEDGKPGVKHAVAMLIGAHFSGQAVASFLDNDRGPIAYAAALGFAGDLFARTTVFEDNEWVQNNLLLSGYDADAEDYDLSGFESDSPLMGLGEGEDGEPLIFEGEDGELYMLDGVAPDPANMPGGSVGAFEADSPLMGVGPSAESSFGYAGARYE